MLQSQKQDKHSKTAFSLLLENLGSDIRELSDHKNLLFSHIYLAFHTIHEMAAEALLTVLMCVRIVQHVVRADQLVVMCREDDLTLSSGLLTPLHDFQNDGRCQLVVKIIQVTDIRLEVVQNFSQLHPCFLAVDGLDRVGQLAQFAAAVEVHIRCISIDPVAHAAAFMLHTEILNLMSVLL